MYPEISEYPPDPDDCCFQFTAADDPALPDFCFIMTHWSEKTWTLNCCFFFCEYVAVSQNGGGEDLGAEFFQGEDLGTCNAGAVGNTDYASRTGS